jgi:YVTN family beta-propeller protein
MEEFSFIVRRCICHWTPLTLATISKIDTGEGPDAFAYEPARGELYVFNHRGNSATVIDAKTSSVVTTISLGGSPEFGVADGAAGRVYCNIEDKNEIAVIDTAKHEVVARWPLAPGAEPTGLSFDPSHHRLFATCQKLLVMVDTESGKVVATVPTGKGADGVAVDFPRELPFLASRPFQPVSRLRL